MFYSVVGDYKYSLHLYLDVVGDVVALVNRFSSITTQKLNLIIFSLEYKMARAHINIFLSFTRQYHYEQITQHLLLSINGSKYYHDLQFKRRMEVSQHGRH